MRTAPVVVVALLGLGLCHGEPLPQQRYASRRQDTINEVIQRLRNTPKAHSLSPSWNGKSPYKVIGVNGLPLQNEVHEPAPGVAQRFSRHSLPPATARAGSGAGPRRRYAYQNLHPSMDHRKNKVVGGPPANVHHQRQQQPQQQQQQQQPELIETPRPAPVRESPVPVHDHFPDFGQNPFQSQEAADFPRQIFEGPPRVKPNLHKGAPRRFHRPHPPLPTHPPLRSPDLEINLASVPSGPGLFGGPSAIPEDIPRAKPLPGGGRKRFHPFENRPSKQPSGHNPFENRPSKPNSHNPFENRPSKPASNPFDARLGGNPFDGPGSRVAQQHQQQPQRFRPGTRKGLRPSFPKGNELQQGFKPRFQGSDSYSFDDDDSPSFKLFNSDDSPLNSGPVVEVDKPLYRPVPPSRRKKVTTPRPIPTPGPNDFPQPPPRRPAPPLTHPTHPPLVTHPPRHAFDVLGFVPSGDHEETTIILEEDADDDEAYYQRPGPSPGLLSRPPPSSFPDRRVDPFHDVMQEPVNNGDDNGFYHVPEDFPSFGSLFPPFESLKIRNKRSVGDDQDGVDLEVGEARLRPRRRIRPQRKIRARNLSGQEQNYGQRNIYRRQDEFNFHQSDFWDDPEDDFFRPPFGQRHQPYRRNVPTYSRQEPPPPQHQRPQQQQQHQHQSGPPPPQQQYHQGYGAHQQQRDPFPQSSIQSYPPSSGDDYGRNTYYEELQRENEILGSGNFEVIKGGTFYDPDTYYNTRYNTRPQHNYNGNFLENFRDFQDIKSDLYRNNQYY